MNIYISMAVLYLLLINTFENAYLFSVCFIIMMVLSDIIISLIKKIVEPNIRIPVSLIVTGTILTIMEILLKKYIPGFYNDMNIYLPLMMLILYDFESKDSFGKSLKHTFVRAFKYSMLLMVVVLIKEILLSNSITLMSNLTSLTGYRAIYNVFPENNLLPNSISAIALSFIAVGIALAIANKVKEGKHA